MFREFMQPMNWSDCLCERFNFPVKCKGGCAQGNEAKVRDDENCEYQMERSVVVWNNTCINRCIREVDYDDDDDDDDKVNQD